MRLQIVRRRTPSIAKFNDKEWKNADIEHYGRPQDFREKEFRVVARDRRKIVGTLLLRIKRGVGEIKSLIVAKDSRGSGIGSLLLNKAEEIARQHKIHKIWLETGKGWQAERFYRKSGYKKSTLLPRHYAGQDFVMYIKFLAPRSEV